MQYIYLKYSHFFKDADHLCETFIQWRQWHWPLAFQEETYHEHVKSNFSNTKTLGLFNRKTTMPEVKRIMHTRMKHLPVYILGTTFMMQVKLTFIGFNTIHQKTWTLYRALIKILIGNPLKCYWALLQDFCAKHNICAKQKKYIL